ncbi:hypothetical protein DF107_26480 [Burkholderia stagnalis]|uniref:Uncharacterized protein n=1 Tax=Burkholderia stagnalis TaxID=1503054 RepID=A0A3N7YPU7_9BURK|nr:hypothetical protein [Burkholderia stagnalis]AOK56745.1 hypothetical protein WT74_29235 [Burkholderia stagnalis]KAB0632926.1 hypothetical protein F7R25_31710 [Burkholderia stagnalis]KVM83491.1 hypothetical protein WT05_19150 [Burkholderia stagnalis]KVN11483.1 hypothetical protein WT09_22295 [Burkholderia stagnalis]KVN38819.1 hypothetical protein WT11_03600 [Burkholderia stagnalis]
MAECSNCGKTYFVGGRSIDGHRYCGATCAQSHPVIVTAERLSAAEVHLYVDDCRHGPCPICRREDGPVDVHAAHRVVSLIFVTQWATRRHVCCRRCGRRKQAIAMLTSAVCGWWGLPWGVVLTPIQIARNLLGFARREPRTATEQFEQVVRRKLAAHRLRGAARDFAPACE